MSSKRINFRNMDPSAVIEEYANQHLEKAEKFLQNQGRTPVSVEMIIEYYPNHAHNGVEIRVHAPGYHFRAHSEGSDLYKVIDAVSDKMMHELRQKKEEWVDRHKHGCSKTCKLHHNERQERYLIKEDEFNED